MFRNDFRPLHERDSTLLPAGKRNFHPKTDMPSPSPSGFSPAQGDQKSVFQDIPQNPPDSGECGTGTCQRTAIRRLPVSTPYCTVRRADGGETAFRRALVKLRNPLESIHPCLAPECAPRALSTVSPLPMHSQTPPNVKAYNHRWFSLEYAPRALSIFSPPTARFHLPTHAKVSGHHCLLPRCAPRALSAISPPLVRFQTPPHARALRHSLFSSEYPRR